MAKEEMVEVTVLDGKSHMGPDGNIVGDGGTYTTTRRQADQLVARQLVKIGKTVEEADEPETTTATTTDKQPERWTLKISPKDYIDRFPEGPQVELAKKLVKDGKGDMTAGGE
jgi:hypothetical protein